MSWWQKEDNRKCAWWSRVAFILYFSVVPLLVHLLYTHWQTGDTNYSLKTAVMGSLFFFSCGTLSVQNHEKTETSRIYDAAVYRCDCCVTSRLLLENEGVKNWKTSPTRGAKCYPPLPLSLGSSPSVLHHHFAFKNKNKKIRPWVPKCPAEQNVAHGTEITCFFFLHALENESRCSCCPELKRSLWLVKGMSIVRDFFFF